MNELVYRNLSEDAKRQICAWKYGGEYLSLIQSDAADE